MGMHKYCEFHWSNKAKSVAYAMKARLFARLRAHFQWRDRLRLVIGYRRKYLEALVRQGRGRGREDRAGRPAGGRAAGAVAGREISRGIRPPGRAVPPQPRQRKQRKEVEVAGLAKNAVILNGISPRAKAGAKRREEPNPRDSARAKAGAILSLNGRRRSGAWCAHLTHRLRPLYSQRFFTPFPPAFAHRELRSE